MNHRTTLLAVAAAAGLLAGAAQAQPATVAKPAKAMQFLTIAQLDPAMMLPPPVKDGSDLQKAELADVEQVYRNRTPERRARAEWDDKHESAELFFGVLGPNFDLAKLPATAKLLAAEDEEQSIATNIAKRYFLRNRPWAIDPSLVACDYKPNAAPLTSYPSGHATLAYSSGYILAQLMPEKSQAILERAGDYAYSRVVCGAHYRSDIEASHVFGAELAMMLMDNPKFAALFKASQNELRAAGLTRAPAAVTADRAKVRPAG